MDRPGAALNRLPRWLVGALVAPPVIAVGALYVWPMVTLLTRVLSLDAAGDVLSRARVWETLWFTTWQAILSTALTLAVGLPVAGLLTRYRFPGRRLLLTAVSVPFLLPTVVVGAAFAALLPASWDATVRAVLVAHVYFNVAVVVRVVGSSWARVPHDLAAAAATLGLPPWQVAARVTLPLLRPAIAAAAGVVFAFCFTSFGVVRILGSPAQPTLEMEIARRATQLGDVGGAALLSMVQLIALALVVVVSTRVGRHHHAFVGTAGQRPIRRHRIATLAAAATTGALAVAPLVALTIASVRIDGSWTLAAWRALFEDPTGRPGVDLGVDALDALAVSMRSAALAALLAALIGGTAVLAIRATRRTGRLLDVALMLPLVTSAVTLGLGLLITFDTAPFDWRAAWWFVAVGQALVAVPFVVRAMLPNARAIPDDLRAAAATLGASPTRAWVEVDLRLLARPLLAATAFAAAIALGEFGATSVLSRTGSDSVPMAVAALLGRTGDLPRAQGFALATILLVVVAALVMFADPNAGTLGEERRARRR